MFTEAHRELPADQRAVVSAKRDRYADEFEELLAQAEADGDLREVNTTLARLSVLGMASWAYHWLDMTGSLDVDDIARFMWDVVFLGLKPRA